MSISPRPAPKILIILDWDEANQLKYEKLIKARLPELPIVTVRTAEEIQREIPEAEIVMAFGVQLQRGVFQDAAQLRWIHSFGTGVDGIIDQPGLPAEVIITATRGIHGPAMSELALLLMLSLARDFPRTIHAQARQHWDRWRVGLLHGKTVGILGVGLIAEDLAPKCKALGMQVVGLSRTTRTVAGFDRFYPREEILTAVGTLDFLVLLIPYSAATHHIVNDAVLNAMKPTSYLINIARGGVLDENALARALQRRAIAGAAIDVMQVEPLPPDNALWREERLIITPHLGGYYDRYIEDSVDQICDNLQCYTSGQLDGMKNKIDRP